MSTRCFINVSLKVHVYRTACHVLSFSVPVLGRRNDNNAGNTAHTITHTQSYGFVRVARSIEMQAWSTCRKSGVACPDYQENGRGLDFDLSIDYPSVYRHPRPSRFALIVKPNNDIRRDWTCVYIDS